MKHNLNSRFLLTAVFAVIITAIGSDEPFPSAEQPVDVLSIETAIKGPDTLFCEYDNFAKAWSFGAPLIAIVRVINKYDNLLQGEARAEGHIDFQSFGASPKLIVIPFSHGSLRKPPIFAGNIALAPDSAAEFQTLWIPFATDGKVIWEGNPYVTLPTKEKLYGPIPFLFIGEVRLFDKIQPMKIPETRFSMYFKVKD
jgi:hypothetical protein